MAAVALTAALTMGPLPFFHTDVELADWSSSWNQRMAAGETPTLIVEFLDMSERHPCRLVECPEPKVQVAHRTTNSAPIRHELAGGVEQWRSLVAVYFPADQVDRALRVMACESGGDPNAYNPSGASGLMQVLASWADNFGYRPTDLFDPAINLQVARYLWDDGEARVGNGWVHWVCKG